MAHGKTPEGLVKAALGKVFGELGVSAQPFSTVIRREATSRVVQMGDSGISIRAAVGNREYRLFSIPLRRTQFWLAVECKFEGVVDEERLGGVSVVVFRGPMIESDKEALFRAEWDSAPAAGHAQPHWHLYAANAAVVLEAAEASSTTAFGRGADATVEGIHFAMSATWHIAPFTQYVDLDLEGGRNWMLNCVRYIVAQLRYLEGE